MRDIWSRVNFKNHVVARLEVQGQRTAEGIVTWPLAVTLLAIFMLLTLGARL